jgi:tetratricopeptide (TPR) repeat protein
MEGRFKPGNITKVLIPAAVLLLLGALFLSQISINDPWKNTVYEETSVDSDLLEDNSENINARLKSSQLEQLGLEALTSGDPAAAVMNLEEAYLLSGLSPEGWMTLGDAYSQLGHIDNALGAWENLPPSPELYSRLTEAYFVMDDFDGLLTFMSDLLNQSPGDANLYFHLGLLYAAHKPDSSLAFLEQAASIEPEFNEVTTRIIRTIRSARLLDEPAYTLVSTGRELANLNQWILAHEAFRRAISLREDYAEAWAFYGEAIQQVNNQINDIKTGIDEPDVSLTALEKAVQLDPESLSAHIFLSIYWQRQGEFEQAAAILESAALLEPENPVVWAELGRCWAKAGDLSKAQENLEKAVDLSPEDPFYWALIADYSINYQVQIKELGLPAARKAVLLAPDSAEYLTLLGQAFYFLGDHSNAEKFMNEALDKEPEYAPAYLHLGMNALAKGDSNQAREHFTLAGSLGEGSLTAEQARRLLERHFP